MFWSTDDGLYNVDELAKSAPKTIELATSRNVPAEDMSLLDAAFKHVYVKP
jgi:hypothetical protein